MSNGNGKGGALVAYKEKVGGIRTLLEKSKTQIGMALPKHMNADRLLRIVMTSVQRTPKLLDCTKESLCGAVIQSAQLGLECDNVLGHAYLVPFWNKKKGVLEVQFIPGYKGLIDLARRSGQVSTIYAHVVRDGDMFEYEFGLDATLRHKPAFAGAGGGVTHAYAVCKLKDGGEQFDVMPRYEVEAIRARSQSKDSGPWVTDYDEMAKKTILRRLCKLLPCSVEMARAVALDERADIGLPQDLGALIDVDEPQTSPMDELEGEIVTDHREPGQEG